MLGIVLVLVGVVLALPLVPGPGIPVVFVGLTVLSTEFEWARRLRNWVHLTFKRTLERANGR